MVTTSPHPAGVGGHGTGTAAATGRPLATIVPLPGPARAPKSNRRRRGPAVRLAQALRHLRTGTAAEGIPPHPSPSSAISPRTASPWPVRFPDDVA